MPQDKAGENGVQKIQMLWKKQGEKMGMKIYRQFEVGFQSGMLNDRAQHKSSYLLAGCPVPVTHGLKISASVKGILLLSVSFTLKRLMYNLFRFHLLYFCAYDKLF